MARTKPRKPVSRPASGSRGTKSKSKAGPGTSKNTISTAKDKKTIPALKVGDDIGGQFPSPNSLNSGSEAGNEAGSAEEKWMGSGPDPNEWDNRSIYNIYKSFRRSDVGESIFVGDFVYVWGDDGNGDYKKQSERIRWTGRVCGIRARETTKVFMEIAWLYTTNRQLKESKIVFPRRKLAKNECVISGMKDIVNVWCVEGLAPVKRFDELDPWQEEIDSDEEYYRSEIITDKAGRLRVKQFRPAGSKKHYTPFTTQMVYCPRPSCLKWYHQNLIKKLPIPTKDQTLGMQSTGLELLDSRPPPKEDPNPSDSDSSSNAELILSEKEIRRSWRKIGRFASTSITRGVDSVVGNTVAVLEAREIVAMDDGDVEEMEKLMKEWVRNHDPQVGAQVDSDDPADEVKMDADESESEEDEVEQMGRWICPGCKRII